MKGRFRLNIRHPEVRERYTEVSARYRESATRTRVSDSSLFRCQPRLSGESADTLTIGNIERDSANSFELASFAHAVNLIL